MNNKWLEWVTELQSIAQAGLAFSDNKYDIERYQRIRALSVTILHEYTGVDHSIISNLFAGETGYQTPKVDVRAAVFREDEILMVREKVDGKWALPGGWADVNTTVGESVTRECREEAGAVVSPKRIIAIHTANRHNDLIYPFTIYKIFVECDLINYNFSENIETLEAGFFKRDSLPELSVERNTTMQINMCFEAKMQRLLEAEFD